jgi:2-polyprenyl-3-methyl-5-hydroxy-6-metoxy-1,4-benzoquinol methylase
MRSVNPKIYTRDYYFSVCLGSEEFKKSNGTVIHSRLIKLLGTIPLKENVKILDIGCGRGDISHFFAKNGYTTVGVDYAPEAIRIAKGIKKKASQSVKKKLSFYLMDVKDLAFKDNTFDIVICIDVLEHLYPEEVEIALNEISRVTKNDGIIFIHTGANKVLYNKVYPFYILPMNKLMTMLDQLIKKKSYASLPKDPRTEEEKNQHVNEPTYYYLNNLFKRHNLAGKINIEIGFLKEGKGIRTKLYNFFVTLYPVSKVTPLNRLFGWVFVANLKNKK